MKFELDHNAFWVTIWAIVLTALVCIVAVANYYGHKEDIIVAELVREGHDKVELSCLYSMTESLQNSCFVLAQTKASIALDKARIEAKHEAEEAMAEK